MLSFYEAAAAVFTERAINSNFEKLFNLDKNLIFQILPGKIFKLCCNRNGIQQRKKKL